MHIKKIHDLITGYKGKGIADAVQEAIDEGIDPNLILNDGLISALDEVGVLFSTGEAFVPEMLRAANIMKQGMEILKPFLATDVEGKGVILIGTVKGDLHDIGKNLVAMLLETSGFTVIDLGLDVSKEEFLQATKDNKVDIICLSALLTTTMSNMRSTVEFIKADGQDVKFLVGGAPVTEKFANDINADGYAADATHAVIKAKELILEKAEGF